MTLIIFPGRQQIWNNFNVISLKDVTKKINPSKFYSDITHIIFGFQFFLT